jgi:hypothetical protein
MPPFQGLSLDASCRRERRSRSSAGLGCPSFGGQRTVGGRFSFPPAKLVAKLKPRRLVTVHQCLRSRPELGVSAAAWSILPTWQPGQTQTAAVLSRGRATVSRVASPVSSGLPALLGKSITVGAAPVPNRSVKGTSRKRAAPYVER